MLKDDHSNDLIDTTLTNTSKCSFLYSKMQVNIENTAHTKIRAEPTNDKKESLTSKKFQK